MEQAAKYDDLLPVSLANDRKRGVFVLLDRHNDRLADFDQSRDDHECQRIVDLINTSAAAYRRGLLKAAQYLVEGEVLTSPDELDAHSKLQCFRVLERVANTLTRLAEGAVDASQAQ